MKVVFFDCFGVLAKEGILEKNVPPEFSKDVLNALIAVDIGKITNDEYLEILGGFLGKTKDELVEILQKTDRKNVVLMEFIKNLRKKNVKTAMISNAGIGTFDNFFSKEELDEMFDEVFVSGELKMMKPNKEIFEFAMKKMETTPENCIFIDDVLKYCESAKNLGMKTILHKENATTMQKVMEFLEMENA